MVGTISLYDRYGERLHTIYVGATPEYGQAAFMEPMEREISHVKQLYPRAVYVGIADGAPSNWDFLKPHTRVQILNFYHAAEYLAGAVQAAYPRSPTKRAEWLETRCHELKHTAGAAALLLEEMEELAQSPLSEFLQEKLQRAITYFSNHQHQMEYAHYRANYFPIGSGVTEAACKTKVLQRLCCSEMRWKEKGAGIVLSLWALVLTQTRWGSILGKHRSIWFSNRRIIYTLYKGPLRRLIPDFQAERLPLTAGRFHFSGHIEFLNERWLVGSKWIGEYVRATINTAKQTLTISHKASDQADWRVIKNRSSRIKESVHALLPQFKRNRTRCRDYLPG